MWAEVSALNLMKVVPALQIPVFFFLGRHDHQVPAETSAAYFDALIAPSKKLVWFEESGHEPFVDEPAKFNTAMVLDTDTIFHGVDRIAAVSEADLPPLRPGMVLAPVVLHYIKVEASRNKVDASGKVA